MPEKKSDIVIAKEQIDENTTNKLLKLIDYYRDFFTPLQIDALIYLWYGYDVSQTAEVLNISSNLINQWLSDKRFRDAVQAGYGRRKEILLHNLENSALKAVEVVDDVLNVEVDSPNDRAYGEKAKMARWILDKLNVNLGKSGEEEQREIAHMTAETAKIIAEELKRTNDTKRSELDNIIDEEDVIEGNFRDLADYYNLVEDQEEPTDYGQVNVIKTQDGYEMRCHLCGRWYQSLAGHIARNRDHQGITTSFYKKNFGLPRDLPLVVDDEFLNISENF